MNRKIKEFYEEHSKVQNEFKIIHFLINSIKALRC